jgi:hypothetical protein
MSGGERDATGVLSFLKSDEGGKTDSMKGN